ncbi:MAG: heme lyase CcmF/NrfE family subunit [Myxococcota bacterium]|nr:heme lyase CcmF/NrfE family subunit [Myxococcota bacterium]
MNHSILGQGLVLGATAVAGFGTMLALLAMRRSSPSRLEASRISLKLYAVFMWLANLTMVRALLQDDFSVSYVAKVGSRASPEWVKIVSLWSSLEGSILLWGAVLGIYGWFFAASMKNRFPEYVPGALTIFHIIAVFFGCLIAGPADPFTPMAEVPADGPGPNPLLQNHILMVVHPPLLYFGYVGMTVPFCIASAALMKGQITPGWLKPLRQWTHVAWIFLTLGIIVGGWWAYEVLGWGGYWAWDPVENASFLPWLAATGYLHSTVAQERRKIFKAWTLSLVLASFILTILGTFMTRSGVFNSVHSFTQSPIGPIFLAFLAVTIVFSVVLLSARMHLLEDEGKIAALMSREAAFLLNNVVFVVFTFTVLLGTVFPLVTEAIKGVKISVGEPYFDQMAAPIGLVLVFLMGIGPILPWGRPDMKQVKEAMILPIVGAIVAAGLGTLHERSSLWTLATFAGCGFAATATLRDMWKPIADRRQRRQEGILKAAQAALSANRRRFGGYVIHIGVIAIIAAIAGSRAYKTSVEVSLAPGESAQLEDITLTYLKTRANQAPHRFEVAADFAVTTQSGSALGTFSPMLVYYPSQREPIGTPDVRTMGNRDIYFSLLAFEKDGSRVSVKAYIMPMVPWLWWSIPILALGSIISLWPRRRRKWQENKATLAAGVKT